MYKSELIECVSKETGISRDNVEAVVDSVLRNITNALARYERVQLTGFGTFDLKEQAAKKGRDIAENKTVFIPQRLVPCFKAGKTLKKAAIKIKGVDFK